MAAFVSQPKQQTRNLGDNERARLSSLQLHLPSPHETGNATTKTIFLCMRAQPDFLAEKFASEQSGSRALKTYKSFFCEGWSNRHNWTDNMILSSLPCLVTVLAGLTFLHCQCQLRGWVNAHTSSFFPWLREVGIRPPLICSPALRHISVPPSYLARSARCKTDILILNSRQALSPRPCSLPYLGDRYLYVDT